MAYEFTLPDIGEGLAEAEITEWLAGVGQEVALDQPLVQIETDKAVTDIPAPRAGVLLHQGAPAGSVIRVGEILAVIGKAGERWPKRNRPTRSAGRVAERTGSPASSPSSASWQGISGSISTPFGGPARPAG